MARGVINIDKADFLTMWERGDSHMAMAAAFGVSDNTIERRAKAWGLPPRFRPRKGIPRNLSAPAVEAPPVPHIAAVRMPDTRVQDRPDWPQISAEIERARGSSVKLGQVAARFRLPYAVLAGLAQRVAA